eukprot:CAMPEP_0116897038 /NCGR_PEP_ID=MMETSP0467-20121206/6136_1 /TAXON_ID=283647 /ORGANISM="Mesodinium pulex, Strain SPMC105" /LENGTH=78 /DNA_ID=CAMNT_0004568517 /DNA_START=977 /DNA_END=1213 /DNA_ORIENTATION=+
MSLDNTRQKNQNRSHRLQVGETIISSNKVVTDLDYEKEQYQQQELDLDNQQGLDLDNKGNNGKKKGNRNSVELHFDEE